VLPQQLPEPTAAYRTSAVVSAFRTRRKALPSCRCRSDSACLSRLGRVGSGARQGILLPGLAGRTACSADDRLGEGAGRVVRTGRKGRLAEVSTKRPARSRFAIFVTRQPSDVRSPFLIRRRSFDTNHEGGNCVNVSASVFKCGRARRELRSPLFLTTARPLSASLWAVLRNLRFTAKRRGRRERRSSQMMLAGRFRVPDSQAHFIRLKGDQFSNVRGAFRGGGGELYALAVGPGAG